MIVAIAQLVVLEKSSPVYAVIICANGENYGELFSEVDAFECILKALKEKKIHPVEATYLREEVRESVLPLETPEGAREAFDEWRWRKSINPLVESRRHLH